MTISDAVGVLATGEIMKQRNKYNHQNLCPQVDAAGSAHVVGGEWAVVMTDVRFLYHFTEISVGAAELAVENARQGTFGISAVGRGVLATIAPDERNELRAACHNHHEQGGEAGRQIVGNVVDARRHVPNCRYRSVR